MIFEDCKLVTPTGLAEASVRVENGRIDSIGKLFPGAEQRYDCKGLLLLPGVIDTHVHFRVPGAEHKEDWFYGSRAAAKGGVTTVLDMPNNAPSITTARLLEEKRKMVKSVVDFGFHFGATPGNIEEILSVERIASIKVFMGSSTGDLLVDNDADIYRVFEAAAKKDVPVTVHAENDALMKYFAEKYAGARKPTVHPKIRCSVCAAEAVARAIILSEKAGNRVHILHMSTREEMDLLAHAHPRVTAEATPHHLFLNSSELSRQGNYAKMNPPLRSEQDRQALWDGIHRLTCFGSDHAPHTMQEKDKDYWHAPSGVPGVEFMLPLLLDAVNAGKLSLQRLVQMTSSNPVRVFGLREKGFGVGRHADFVLVDMKQEKTVHNSDVESKCSWTPYHGKVLQGWPVATFCRGQKVYEDGVFYDNKGMEVF